MEAILIDYDGVISPGSHRELLEHLPPCPPSKKGFVAGLVVIIPKEIKNKLEKLQKGKKRISYLNSKEFVNNLKTSQYLLYNKERDICVLNDDSLFPEFSTPIITGFSDETVIWVCVPLSDPKAIPKITNLIENGFRHPYISKFNPLKEEMKESVCLSRKKERKEETKSSSASVLNKVKHLIQEHKKNKDGCSLFVQLSEDAIHFLEASPKSLGIVVGKGGKKSQKEITGELIVSDVVEKEGKIVYMIGVNESSIESGEDEEIEVNATRYNMHSHPKEAYKRHKVKKAWPSVVDYNGYLSLGEQTIFHITSSLEGAYILSFSPYWGSRLKDIDRAFIDKHYDIDYMEKYTPSQYVEKVNKILYKGHSIFEVKYFPWKKAGTIFKISFPRIGDACLVTQQILEIHRKMNKA